MGIILPGTLTDGVKLNGNPVQTVVLIPAMVAAGFTVTVTVNAPPEQNVVEG